MPYPQQDNRVETAGRYGSLSRTAAKRIDAQLLPQLACPTVEAEAVKAECARPETWRQFALERARLGRRNLVLDRDMKPQRPIVLLLDQTMQPLGHLAMQVGHLAAFDREGGTPAQVHEARDTRRGGGPAAQLGHHQQRNAPGRRGNDRARGAPGQAPSFSSIFNLPSSFSGVVSP